MYVAYNMILRECGLTISVTATYVQVYNTSLYIYKSKVTQVICTSIFIGGYTYMVTMNLLLAMYFCELKYLKAYSINYVATFRDLVN